MTKSAENSGTSLFRLTLSRSESFTSSIFEHRFERLFYPVLRLLKARRFLYLNHTCLAFPSDHKGEATRKMVNAQILAAFRRARRAPPTKPIRSPHTLSSPTQDVRIGAVLFVGWCGAGQSEAGVGGRAEGTRACGGGCETPRGRRW